MRWLLAGLFVCVGVDGCGWDRTQALRRSQVKGAFALALECRLGFVFAYTRPLHSLSTATFCRRMVLTRAHRPTTEQGQEIV